MHKYLVIIALLVLQQAAWATDEIKTASTIKKVVVYRNNAKILRTAKVTVPAGKSEIVLEKLTSGLMTNSIQVKIVNSKVELISAVPRINYLEQSKRSERYKVIQDSMLIVRRKLDKLNIQITALAAKRAILMGHNPLGSAEKQGFTIEDMDQLMTFKEKKILEIDFKNLEYTYTKQDLNTELGHLRNQLNYLNGAKQKASGEVVLQLQASSSTSTDIEISYVVIGASWSPMYDLRSDGIGKPLELVYKASVRQSTGYDWKDVKLVLSTSNPNQNNDRPLMAPIYVDFQPDYGKKGKKGNNYIAYQGSGNVILYTEEEGRRNNLNTPYVNESTVTNSYN
ncbi:MAG: mucoidy inhibitor MuiA family protein [Aureispira sp.]|nr:mucoidy inhibitor MuiA family protein [Aureispira sp.]